MNSPDEKMRVTFGSIKNNSKANKDVKIKPEPRQEALQYNVNKITVEIERTHEEQKGPPQKSKNKNANEQKKARLKVSVANSGKQSPKAGTVIKLAEFDMQKSSPEDQTLAFKTPKISEMKASPQTLSPDDSPQLNNDPKGLNPGDINQQNLEMDIESEADSEVVAITKKNKIDGATYLSEIEKQGNISQTDFKKDQQSQARLTQSVTHAGLSTTDGGGRDSIANLSEQQLLENQTRQISGSILKVHGTDSELQLPQIYDQNNSVRSLQFNNINPFNPQGGIQANKFNGQPLNHRKQQSDALIPIQTYSSLNQSLLDHSKPFKGGHPIINSDDSNQVLPVGVFEKQFTYNTTFISPSQQQTGLQRIDGNILTSKLPSVHQFLNLPSTKKLAGHFQKLDLESKRSRSVLGGEELKSVKNSSSRILANLGKIKPSLREKRHSSLGFVESEEQGELFKKDTEEGDLPKDLYSKKLKYKGSNLDFKSPVVDVKKEVSKKSGKNRFQDAPSESITMPNQVIEEWIDETLKQAEEEKAQDLRQGNSQEIPLKVKADQPLKATIRYGLDNSSLVKNGLTPRLANRLQRMLYVYSVGFYGLIKEIADQAIQKRHVIVNTMKVFYLLLERCQRTDYVLLITQVADDFEREKREIDLRNNNTVEQKDKMILDIKRDKAEREAEIEELKDKIFKEEEAYARLNETYVILQAQNEESLKLRLKTEDRLKSLFVREREMKENNRRDKKAREEAVSASLTQAIVIDKLKEVVEQQKQEILEMTNEQKVRGEQIQADKRTIEILNARIKEIELPSHYLREERNLSKIESQKHKAAANQANFQLETYQRMVSQFEEENKSLKKQNEHLEELSEIFRKKMEAATQQSHEIQKELNINKVQFDNIKEIIKEKDGEIERWRSQYKETKEINYSLDIQCKSYKASSKEINDRIVRIEEENEKQVRDIDVLTKKLMNTQLQFDDEHKKNDELFGLLKEAELKMQDLEAIKLFQTEQKLKDAEIKILKLEEDCKLAKNTKDFNAQMHEKQIDQKQKEINSFLTRIHTTDRELKNTIKENGSKHKQNIALQSRNIQLDEKNKELETKMKNVNDHISELNAKILEQQQTESRSKYRIQELEMELERVGIRKDGIEITKDENIRLLKKELSMYQSSALKAIERNCMTGEDFRSQALNNYHIILQHREEIKELNVLPDKLRQQYKEVKTHFKRRIRNYEMELQDNQASFLALHQKIDTLENTIKEQEDLLATRLRVLTVLQNKFGRELILVDQESQTKFKKKNRGIQVLQQTEDVEIQCEPEVRDAEDQVEPMFLEHDEFEGTGFMESRLGRKKKMKKTGKSFKSSNRSSKSPKKSSLNKIKEKTKGKAKKSRGQSRAQLKSSAGKSIKRNSTISPKRVSIAKTPRSRRASITKASISPKRSPTTRASPAKSKFQDKRKKGSRSPTRKVSPRDSPKNKADQPNNKFDKSKSPQGRSSSLQKNNMSMRRHSSMGQLAGKTKSRQILLSIGANVQSPKLPYHMQNMPQQYDNEIQSHTGGVKVNKIAVYDQSKIRHGRVTPESSPERSDVHSQMKLSPQIFKTSKKFNEPGDVKPERWQIEEESPSIVGDHSPVRKNKFGLTQLQVKSLYNHQDRAQYTHSQQQEGDAKTTSNNKEQEKQVVLNKVQAKIRIKAPPKRQDKKQELSEIKKLIMSASTRKI